jgi:peptidoglycan/xylan/chitin deacetylase (PgdA/CDA1 family)/glycosyltransferase involved in cell wall biosynthesis
MVLLARALGQRGFQVALVVYPLGASLGDDARLTPVERAERGSTTGLGTLIEAVRVLRSLVTSDASVVIVTTGTPVLGFIGLYCRLRRRRLVFASANDLDFDLERSDPTSPGEWERRRWLYRTGIRLVDALVVLSRAQVELAHSAFPFLESRRIVFIPYFAEEFPVVSDRPPPSEFIWAGRMVEEKRPLHYTELAAAVPDARFTMVPLVPPNPTAQDRARLDALNEKAHHLPNLTLLEPLPHAALQERLGQAVALVSTSSIEGWPNTYLEAWSHGVPVLTLLVDPDGVIGERGLGVAANGSWARFVAGAKSLWRTRDDRAELAERTRTYIREVHSFGAVGTQWEGLLADLGTRPQTAETASRQSRNRRGGEVAAAMRIPSALDNRRRFRSLILFYHAVSESWHDELAVTPKAFEAQVRSALRRGFVAASAHDLLDGSRKLLHVTFDDGLRSTRGAIDVLTSLRVPATVFICPDYADDGRPFDVGRLAHVGSEDERETMKWDELRELVELGVEVGSHTNTHAHLTQLSDSELSRELSGSKERLEDELGRPCAFLSYPFGEQDARVRAAAKAAGYTAAFAAPGGYRAVDRFALPRVALYRSDSHRRAALKMSRLGLLIAARREHDH